MGAKRKGSMESEGVFFGIGMAKYRREGRNSLDLEHYYYLFLRDSII
jgi:hypothetical protein